MKTSIIVVLQGTGLVKTSVRVVLLGKGLAARRFSLLPSPWRFDR